MLGNPSAPGVVLSGTSTPIGPIPNTIQDVTLANGMTAGIGTEQTDNLSPQYWANVGQIYGGNPKWPILRAGVMRNIYAITPFDSSTNPNGVKGLTSGQAGTGSGYYYLYFLFNPNQVVSTFQTNTGSYPTLQDLTALGKDGVNGFVPDATSGQTVTWSLFFDRTYDMYLDRQGSFDLIPGSWNRGVLRDIAALLNVTGGVQTGGNTILNQPTQVLFGKTASGQVWGFTGFVTGLSITYGQFSNRMIPYRAEVDITMLARYTPASVPAQGTSTPATSSTPANTGLTSGELGYLIPPQPISGG